VRISEVSVGTEVPPFVVQSVSAEKMKLMAALLHDPNPIHLDPEAVRRLGMGEAVVNQGPANQAYLVNMLTRFAGGPGAVRSITVRFLGNVFAGERVECRGRVSEVDAEAGLVTVDLQESVGERMVMSGTAVVALPR
jgi:3-hydroxybutyryl-CoA dehydratase